ncbi:MAG: acetyl-CoA carboxylase biotin carboxyl carrier protein [Acidobacteriales bacterium]|nr:acetyl-CoA carboxylase biotin carboxyl carrier protein [Terriglobales bacterium]
MNQKEIKELIDFLVEKDIAEFEYERGDVKVRVVRPGAIAPQVVTVPTIQAAAAPTLAAPASSAPRPGESSPKPAPEKPKADEDADLQIVKSPIVGTFYESPSPGAAAFVKEGDRVTAGQVLCIVEAMKLMNEIESEFSGTIVKRFVKNGQPVEYGQRLYSIRKD